MALSTQTAHGKDISTGGGSVDFQHRHFAKIAAILKSIDDRDELSEDHMAMVVETFAKALATTNPKFDNARFVKACGF
jgi:hypothetical protein